MLQKFWNWYEKNLALNLGIAGFLFALQIVHLLWLTTDVVLVKLVGETGFHIHPTGIVEKLILIVDYLEIPAIISTSLVYINDYRKTKSQKSLLYLFFINSQWLHLFWITDEFVVDVFTGNTTASHLPPFLAWIAIGIDYLELPVIYDTVKRFIVEIKKGDVKKALLALQEAD